TSKSRDVTRTDFSALAEAARIEVGTAPMLTIGAPKARFGSSRTSFLLLIGHHSFGRSSLYSTPLRAWRTRIDASHWPLATRNRFCSPTSARIRLPSVLN